MPVGTIYCVKMEGTIFSQEMLNVFFYEETIPGVPDDAEGLFDAFDQFILAQWKFTVTNQVDILNVEVFAPLTPSDFHDGQPANNKGTRTAPAGERMSSYNCFSYRSNRAGPGTRSSFKRFSGLMESDQDANSLSASFLAIPEVGFLADNMGGVIDDGAAGATYKPVQVKHPVPLFFAPVKNFDITSWGGAFATSQVSRKPPAGT